MHDTAPPHFWAFRIHRLHALCAPPETLAEPSYCRYLQYIVRSLHEHRPSTACLATTPARGQQPLPSPPTWATSTTRPSVLAPTPLTGLKPPLAVRPSSTAQPQMTFPIPVHRHPGALPSADTAHHLPTLVCHHGLPCSSVLILVFVFVSLGETIFFADRMFHRQWTPNGFLFDLQPHSRP